MFSSTRGLTLAGALFVMICMFYLSTSSRHGSTFNNPSPLKGGYPEGSMCPASCLSRLPDLKATLDIPHLCASVGYVKDPASPSAASPDNPIHQIEEPVAGPAGYSPGVLDHNLRDVMNETLGFEKIFVVSLPERHDKLDAQTLSSSLTGFRFEVIPGIRGKDVSLASLPPSYNVTTINEGIQTIGAWRAELNAVRMIITQRLSSALIVEDDSDWDVHLKYQLVDIARGNRFLSLPAPIADLENSPLPIDDGTPRFQATNSPYGNDWDIIWLGHCGSRANPEGRRFVLQNDPTVPLKSDLHTPAGSPEPNRVWEDEPGTRIMYRTGDGVCSWTYAVSFKGAQRLVNAMSIEPFNEGFDEGLGHLCGRGVLKCTHVYPPIFGAHAPAGAVSKESDITGDRAGDGVRLKGRTHNVLYSTRLNIKNLLAGKNVEPQYENVPKLSGPMQRSFLLKV